MAQTPCSKHQGRGKTPKICTLEFSGLMFDMEKISLPLHSQQTLLTIRSISNNLISQTPQSVSWHSRISSRCSVALSGYVPAQSVLCRTGQKKHVWSLMHVQHYSIGSVWFLTNLSAGDGVRLWHCFEMHCPVVFPLSTVLFPHQYAGVCVSFCRGAVAALTGHRRPGSGHGDWSVTYHERQEEYLSSPASLTASVPVFCHFLPTTYCQCSQVCALFSAADHATLLDPSWALLATIGWDWETLKNFLLQNIYF